MGFYIETGTLHNKASIIAERWDGEEVERPNSFSDVPEGKALICVVDNGPFEAAGYVHNEHEFMRWIEPSDARPKRWLIMSKKQAQELTGFREI